MNPTDFSENKESCEQLDENNTNNGMNAILEISIGVLELFISESKKTIGKSIKCLELELKPSIPAEIKETFKNIQIKTLQTNISTYKTAELATYLVKDIQNNFDRGRKQQTLNINSGAGISLLLLSFLATTLASSTADVDIYGSTRSSTDFSGEASVLPICDTYTDEDLSRMYLDLGKATTSAGCQYQNSRFITSKTYGLQDFRSTVEDINVPENETHAQQMKRSLQYLEVNLYTSLLHHNAPQFTKHMQLRLKPINIHLKSLDNAVESFARGQFSDVGDVRTGRTVFDNSKEKTYILQNIPNDETLQNDVNTRNADAAYDELMKPKHTKQTDSKEVVSHTNTDIQIEHSYKGQTKVKTSIAYNTALNTMLDFEITVECEMVLPVSPTNPQIICYFTIIGPATSTFNSGILFQNLETKLMTTSGLEGVQLGSPTAAIQSLAIHAKKVSGSLFTESKLPNEKSIDFIDTADAISELKQTLLNTPIFLNTLAKSQFRFLLEEDYLEIYKSYVNVLGPDELLAACDKTCFFSRLTRNLKRSEGQRKYLLNLDANNTELDYISSFFKDSKDSLLGREIIDLLGSSSVNVVKLLRTTSDALYVAGNDTVATGFRIYDNSLHKVEVGADVVSTVGVVGMGSYAAIQIALFLIGGLMASVVCFLRFKSKLTKVLNRIKLADREEEIKYKGQLANLELRDQTETFENAQNLEALKSKQAIESSGSNQLTIKPAFEPAEEVGRKEVLFANLARDLSVAPNKKKEYFLSDYPFNAQKIKLYLSEKGVVKTGNSNLKETANGGKYFDWAENPNGGAKTRRHKKRVGAASKHHNKRRRGTKKPSKKRRATRRKKN